MANYSLKNFLTTYRLGTIHPLQTTGKRTDKRRQTTTMPIARPFLKYKWLK